MVSKNKKKFEDELEELPEVKDKKKLPPKFEHKVLTKEAIIKLKREMTDLAKSKLNTNGGKL